jgi:hypothetical protein
MRKLSNAALACAASVLLAGCFYTSPTPLIADNGQSCGGYDGSWSVYDPQRMMQARQTGVQPEPVGRAVFTQTPTGCALSVRARPGNGLPTTNMLGANRDLNNAVAVSYVQAMGQGATLSLIQVKPSAAPGVSFGASASQLYALAVRIDVAQGSMLTIIRPACAQASCTVSSLAQARSMAVSQLQSQQQNPSNVLAVLRR